MKELAVSVGEYQAVVELVVNLSGIVQIALDFWMKVWGTLKRICFLCESDHSVCLDLKPASEMNCMNVAAAWI